MDAGTGRECEVWQGRRCRESQGRPHAEELRLWVAPWDPMQR